MKKSLLFITLLLLTMCGCNSDKLHELHNLEGSISSTGGSPLGGINVELVTIDKTYSAITDEQGLFYFSDVPTGLGMFVVNKEEYIPLQKRIVIGHEKTGSMDYVLQTCSEGSFLTISTPPITLHSSETKATLSIQASTPFSVSYQGDWLQISDKIHQPGESVIVITTTNEALEERIAEIIITGEYGQMEKTILKQKARPEPFTFH